MRRRAGASGVRNLPSNDRSWVQDLCASLECFHSEQGDTTQSMSSGYWENLPEKNTCLFSIETSLYFKTKGPIQSVSLTCYRLRNIRYILKQLPIKANICSCCPHFRTQGIYPSASAYYSHPISHHCAAATPSGSLDSLTSEVLNIQPCSRTGTWVHAYNPVLLGPEPQTLIHWELKKATQNRYFEPTTLWLPGRDLTPDSTLE